MDVLMIVLRFLPFHCTFLKHYFICRASERSITVYDLTNKLVALSTRVRGLAGVVGEWGGLYLVTTEPSLILMSEKDLHSKFQLLFKKNQFDIAIR